MTLHRNPIFQADIGTSVDSLCVDLMHCLFLGTAKAYCVLAIWRLFNANIFNAPAGAMEVRIHTFTQQFRANLFAWYKRQLPGRFTELQYLVPSMIGTEQAPCLRTKAAETKGLCYYLAEQVAAYAWRVLSGATLVACGNALIRH
eukprot:2733484-Lingulodinium_polyedra.AAC.1